jgi:hypothetical protein
MMQRWKKVGLVNRQKTIEFETKGKRQETKTGMPVYRKLNLDKRQETKDRYAGFRKLNLRQMTKLKPTQFLEF